MSGIRARIQRQFSRLKAYEYLFMILVGVLIGLGGGFVAVGFRYLIRLVQRVAFGTWNFNVGAATSMPWYVLIFIPAIGGILVAPLVFRVAREAFGHGVPEVMESVAIRGGVIRTRLVLVKALASALTIGTGGSVGREGPIVQVGAAFGSMFGQMFRVSAQRLRTMVGCGAAAGIAGTFNAPIAGALFAVEIILGDFGVAHFSPIVISSVVSTVVSRYFLGDMPAFIVPHYQLVSAFELLPYAVLGLAAALVGVTFVVLLYWTEDFFERSKLPDLTRPCIGGLMVGVMALAFPQILGVGYEAIDMALVGRMSWYFLLGLIFVKMVATSVTLGSGGSGGVFAPALFLGSMTGGLLGTWVHHWFPDITAGSGAYAMVGMGAVMAATTHAPLTAMIIIFEMTGEYKVIPPLMTACVIATVLATRLKRTSIFTERLSRRGVEIFGQSELNVMKRLPISSVITRDPVLIPQNTPFKKLVDLAVNSPQSEFFVVREDNSYVGTISVHNLRQIILDGDWLDQLIIASDMADPNYPVLQLTDDLDLAMKLFAQEHVDELPVVSEGKVEGSVRKVHVLEVYNREVMRRELSSGFQGTLTWVERAKAIDLGEDYIMAETEAPPHFVGQTLRELDVRASYGVEVVLIKRSEKAAGENGAVVPPVDYRIQYADVLLVAGKKEDVRRLLE